MAKLTPEKIAELLPCPFCGGEAHLVIEDEFSRFRCGQCGATGAPAEYGREYDATAAWNRRASHLLASASGGEKSRGTLAGFDCQMQTAYVCASLEYGEQQKLFALHNSLLSRATASESEVQLLQERVGMLEKALEPFAKAASDYERQGGDDA